MDRAYEKAILLLKLGIAFSFAYPAISSLIEPALWIGYAPSWIEIFLPRETFLTIFSTFEIVVAFSVLFWDKIYPAILAGLILLLIVAFNTSEFSVVFRDIPIAIMSFALALLISKR